MEDYNSGKWIGWNGGECPVHPETVVEYVWDNDTPPITEEAGTVHWSSNSAMAKVVAFRVIKEHRPAREWWIDPVSQHVVSHKPNINTSAYIHVKEQQE